MVSKKDVIITILQVLVVGLMVAVAGKSGYNSGYFDGVKDTTCPAGEDLFFNEKTGVISCGMPYNNPVLSSTDGLSVNFTNFGGGIDDS